jgi:hypothetical protein
VAVDMRERSVRLAWDGVAGAASYVIKISAAGTTVPEITTALATTTHDLSDLPTGLLTFVVCVQQATGTCLPSGPVQFHLQDYKYLFEALVLRRGPYTTDTAPPYDGVRGWRPGTNIQVRVANTVTSEARQGLENVVAQLASVGAPFSATVEGVNSNDLPLAHDQITVVTQDWCGPGASCVQLFDRSLAPSPDFFGQRHQIMSHVRVILYPGAGAATAAHEFGHALMGMSHVHYPDVPSSQIGTLAFPTVIMFGRFFSDNWSPRLSDLEVQVMGDLFRSGASAGASSAELRNRGLIH